MGAKVGLERVTQIIVITAVLLQNLRALTREDVDKAYVTSLHSSVTGPVRHKGMIQNSLAI